MSTFTTSTTKSRPAINWAGIFPTFTYQPSVMKSAARRRGLRAVESTLFHGVRLPSYWGRAAKPRNVARGAGIAISGTVGFITNAEGRRLKGNESRSSDPAAPANWLALRAAHKEDRNVRLGGLAAAGVTYKVAGWMGYLEWMNTSPTVHNGIVASLVLGGVAGLGVLGRPDDADPIMEQVTYSPSATALTNGLILESLRELGLSKLRNAIDNDPKSVRFHGFVAQGPTGWSAVFDLPMGTTAKDVIDRHNTFAGNLGAWKAEQVNVSEGEIPNRVILFISHQTAAERPQKPHPFLKLEAIDLFDRYALGVNDQGEWVGFRIMGTNVLIGGVPESGKTSDVMVHLSAAALDPRCEIAGLFEFKGTGDFDRFEPLSRRFGAGNEPEVIESAIKALRALRQECRDRAKLVRASALCPESKVTTVAASEQGSGLHPLIFVLDEVQELILDETHGAEAAALLKAIMKIDRACGVAVFLSTQTPTAESLPTEITKSMGTRICHRVLDHETNDRILPSGSYSAKVRATTIPEEEKGGAIVVGGGSSAPRRLRCSYLTPANIEDIVNAGIEFRGGTVEKAIDEVENVSDAAYAFLGALADEVGKPAPVTDAAPGVPTMTHIAAVIADVPLAKLQSQQILERLQDVFKVRYDATVAADVTNVLREHGVTIIPNVHKKDTIVDGVKKPTTRPGIELDDVRKLVSA